MSDAFYIDALRFFERNEDFTIVWKHLPHWTQAATLTFITWRLADSLSAVVIAEWQLYRTPVALLTGELSGQFQ